MSSLRDLYSRTPRGLRKIIHPILHPVRAFVDSYSLRRAGGVVAIGPSRGLRFGQTLAEIEIEVAKLLGTYEMELHPVLEIIRSHNFERVVDVGAAEGYYAVGLLVSHPRLRVTAFEVQEGHRARLTRLASENGVDERLEIRGYCDHTSLNSLGESLENAFIIVDVEGFEKELLNPSLIPALQAATILVEVHDCFVPGCSDAIRARFIQTHDLLELRSEPRHASEYPFEGWVKRSRFTRRAVQAAMSDGRTQANGWIFLQPK